MTKEDLTRTWRQREIVTRSAPRWAWDVIDETLAMDAKAGNFDPGLRRQIEEAFAAMIASCENPD